MNLTIKLGRRVIYDVRDPTIVQVLKYADEIYIVYSQLILSSMSRHGFGCKELDQSLIKV